MMAVANPIQKVVIFFMENHTTDNAASEVAGVDGDLAVPLAPDVVTPDPPHDHTHWLTRDNPAPAGALRQRFNRQQVPNLYKLMDAVTVCDRYFSDYAGNSFPNHAFAIGADAEWADRNPGVNFAVSLKTPGVPARLLAAGKTWGNYGRGFAFQHYQDPLMHATPKSAFVQDAKAGTLPNVSWVYAPRGQDFHPGPQTKMSASDSWLGQAFAALAHGPDWPHVVIFLTFDDWGGWSDHVVPPLVETFPNSKDQYRFGSRVPCVVAGPYAKAKFISHVQSSHTSLVAFIERLWGLPPSPNPDAARRTASPTEHAMADCTDVSQKPLPPPM
jgi:phospholipase C